ncbi:MAG: hypothetical protein QN720_11115 [Nitrososphaeraceae archaeon]|nr:hypothetical protein [Nitrososphaeraceae archaeon]
MGCYRISYHVYKLGINSIIENATGSATEIVKNASRDIVGSSFDK